MYSTLVSAALFAALAGSALADLQIATPPELVQCQDVRLTWGQSQAPYDLVVAPASDPCGTVLADLGGNHTSTSLNWKADLAAGTEVVFSLLDGDGNEGWTGSVTVKASNDSSCLPNANKTGSSTASSGSVTPTPATTLIVPPNNVQQTPPPSTPSDGSGAVPVGAANSGMNPSSGASSHTFSGATVAFSVVVAVVLAMSL